jgi:GTP-binding protein
MKTIVIVGRPNVGKSTLFNRWIGKRKALVHKEPGMTRDFISHSLPGYDLLDTGGIDFGAGDDTSEMIRRQALFALEGADLVLFLVDAKEGIHPLDLEMAAFLRRSSKPVFLVVNKMDAKIGERQMPEFYSMGFTEIYAVSAEHGDGAIDLREKCEAYLKIEAPSDEEAPRLPRVAIAGRPNVGKSSLLNALLGSPRVSVSSIPGTTRDLVDVEVAHGGKRFVFVDTAGLRKAGKITKGQESLSVVKAKHAIRACDVCLFVLDASQEPAHQDKEIIGEILNEYKGLIIVGNKSDLLTAQEKVEFPQKVEDTFPFIFWVPIVLVSALTHAKVDHVWKELDEVMEAYHMRLPTGPLNRLFQGMIKRIPPRERKFFFITQASASPPTFILVGNRGGRLPQDYQKYLEKGIRSSYAFKGAPLKMMVRKR